MSNYQGHFMPKPEESQYMPEAFANFIANENSDCISPRETGVIELYSETGWSSSSQQVPVLLERFKESAETGSDISPDEIEDAESWAAGFKQKYGLYATFHFHL